MASNVLIQQETPKKWVYYTCKLEIMWNLNLNNIIIISFGLVVSMLYSADIHEKHIIFKFYFVEMLDINFYFIFPLEFYKLFYFLA